MNANLYAFVLIVIDVISDSSLGGNLLSPNLCHKSVTGKTVFF